MNIFTDFNIFTVISILIFLMFIIIPIGHGGGKVRRIPWISFFIMAACLVIQILISVEIGKKGEELESSAKELLNYYTQHPYLTLDAEAKKLLFGKKENEDVEKMLAAYRRWESRKIHIFQVEEQQKLDQLSQKLKNTIDDVPYRKYGFIPAQKSFIGLVTYMFIHGGWLHLIFNLLFLYLSGPFIEDVWGKPIYTAFYLIAGMFSGLMFSLYYPNFMGPLIGASGAVAGLMGVFLIRYWKVKIIFFWLPYFLVTRRTFYLPARVMLPLWLALEILYANVHDHSFPGGASGGVAYWAHVWGFLFGVVVAAGMKRFKIEEKYVHPKIEAQVHFVDEGYKAFEEATQKRNEGKTDEAYALLLVAARKNPMDKDVVERLWNQGKELGKEKEAAEFYSRMIEREIRHNLMDVAFDHFADLKEKVPQASISMTCKFTLMTYLTERQEYKDAKELASELIEEVDLNSSPGLLQNFASAASEHSPEIAKKVIGLCLKHPGITDEQKDVLKTKLKELQNRLPESPPVIDMGEAHAVARNTEQLTAELERQMGLSPEVQQGVEPKVQPLADSVGQTKEELIGQRGPDPNVQPEVEPGIQPAVETQSEPAVEPEGQLSSVPESQPAAEPEIQQAAEPEGQSELSPEVQPLADTISLPVVEAESQPAAEPDKPESSPAQNQPIMAVKATPLSVNDGKIALNMDEIGQQLLPLNKVKSIAVAEIASERELPFLLIDLFLDDPKTNDHKIRTIRILSTSFDPTKFSPGIQDHQDALKVFISVLLKLSGATAYPNEDSILLDVHQSFSSIENYEKSILS